jgi:arylsulfatase A-like enzyme
VPLVIHLPGGEAGGRRVSTLAQQTDVLPTILELASVAAPPGLQGRSLLPRVRNADGEPPPEGDVGWSYLAKDNLLQQSVIGDRYKLIWYQRDDGGELQRLYDLHEDPGEGTNLARRRPVRAGYLRSLLRFVDHAWRPRAEVEEGSMDAELEERLRALGYLR